MRVHTPGEPAYVSTFSINCVVFVVVGLIALKNARWLHGSPRHLWRHRAAVALAGRMLVSFTWGQFVLCPITGGQERS